DRSRQSWVDEGEGLDHVGAAEGHVLRGGRAVAGGHATLGEPVVAERQAGDAAVTGDCVGGAGAGRDAVLDAHRAAGRGHVLVGGEGDAAHRVAGIVLLVDVGPAAVGQRDRLGGDEV